MIRNAVYVLPTRCDDYGDPGHTDDNCAGCHAVRLMRQDFKVSVLQAAARYARTGEVDVHEQDDAKEPGDGDEALYYCSGCGIAYEPRETIDQPLSLCVLPRGCPCQAQASRRESSTATGRDYATTWVASTPRRARRRRVMVTGNGIAASR